jgi:3-phenylpropionate/trans-cinnamate dioxygenase ferredoxin reductase subunit
MDIVIIGGGLAAAKAAAALREGGHDGGLTIIGDEDRAPYERPPLSKDVLLGEGTLDDATVQPEAWYAEHDVRLVTGTAAERLDVEAHRVHLADGQAVPFDKAVIATGARPAVPDAIAGGADAYFLRNAADVERLSAAFADASSVVIVGGGWIGLEVAAAARHHDLETTVVLQEDVPLQHVMGERIGRYFGDVHTSHGVTLRAGERVDAVTARTVKLGGGEVLEADVVVLAVGATPNVELADEAGLLVDGGVVTDEHFATSHPDVYAIGDVSSTLHTGRGEAVRVEHWDDAVKQGEAVAKVLLGEDVAYDWEPYFFTDQYDLGMEYVGHGSADDDVVVRGDLDDGSGEGEFIVFWLRDGVVTAAMNVNIWDVQDDLRALVGTRVDADRLADPSVELADLP